MKLEDLRNVSESTKKRNRSLFPDLFVDKLAPQSTKRNEVSSLDSGVQKPTSSKESFQIRVTLTAYRRRRIDPDSIDYSFKPLTDEIADFFGLDDGGPYIKFEYHQVETKGRLGVIVMIERVK